MVSPSLPAATMEPARSSAPLLAWFRIASDSVPGRQLALLQRAQIEGPDGAGVGWQRGRVIGEFDAEDRRGTGDGAAVDHRLGRGGKWFGKDAGYKGIDKTLGIVEMPNQGGLFQTIEMFRKWHAFITRMMCPKGSAWMLNSFQRPLPWRSAPSAAPW